MGMLEQNVAVVPAAAGWHVAAIHHDDPHTIHLYAVAAWLVDEGEGGEPQLVPFIAHYGHGSSPVELFKPEDTLAAVVVPPDGNLDETALRSTARRASERL